MHPHSGCFSGNNNNKPYNMKKIIVILAALSVSFGMAQAQSLEEITDLYNTGASMLTSGDKELALKAFEQAYEQAQLLGPDGQEMADKCKEVIPDLYLSIAKGMVNDADYAGALAQLDKAVEIANSFGDTGVADEASALLPVVLKQNGGVLLNNKDYAGAADAYRKALEINPSDGVAALRLGLALNGADDLEGAKAALAQAAANGQESAANKQLATINLKEAAAAVKAKKYADAVTAALEAAKYNETVQAYQIAASASQVLGKTSDAISYYEKCLEIDPDAKNATQIAFTIGALYQQSKNNAKAVEFYQKAVSDPALGAQAQQLINALK